MRAPAMRWCGLILKIDEVPSSRLASASRLFAFPQNLIDQNHVGLALVRRG